MEDKLDLLLKKLDAFEDKLTSLENKVGIVCQRDEEIKDILENEIKTVLENDIKNKLEENTEDCKKMSNHIDFIERVYSTLRSPLNYLISGFQRTENLPSLEG